MSKEVENMERLMKNKQVEFRDFNLTNIETRQDDTGNEKLIIEGTPCIYNRETVLCKDDYWEFREIIDSRAFDEADMTDVIFNFNHGGRVFARTRNESLQLENKPDALHMKTELWQDDEGHAELYRDIKRKNLDKMSFAFTVKECEYHSFEKEDGKNIRLRTITKIDKLYDVSAVDFPAYDATEISARRIFDAESGKEELEKAKAESRARALYEYTKLKEGK